MSGHLALFVASFLLPAASGVESPGRHLIRHEHPPAHERRPIRYELPVPHEGLSDNERTSSFIQKSDEASAASTREDVSFVVWKTMQNAEGRERGGLDSVGGSWGSSYGIAGLEISNLDSMFTGIEFKIDKGEAMLGLACEEAGVSYYVLQNDSCFYSIFRDVTGEAYIKERGHSFDWRPTTLPLRLNERDVFGRRDWGLDRWQLRLSERGYVEYVLNEEVFYTSTTQPSFPVRVIATFNQGGSISNANWVQTSSVQYVGWQDKQNVVGAARGGLVASDQDSAPHCALSNSVTGTRGMFSGIEFKFNKGPATLGLACDTAQISSLAQDPTQSVSCLYACARTATDAVEIIDNGQKVDLTGRLDTFNLLNDIWGVRFSRDGFVEYIHNGYLVHTSAERFVGSSKIFANMLPGSIVDTVALTKSPILSIPWSAMKNVQLMDENGLRARGGSKVKAGQAYAASDISIENSFDMFTGIKFKLLVGYSTVGLTCATLTPGEILSKKNACFYGISRNGSAYSIMEPGRVTSLTSLNTNLTVNDLNSGELTVRLRYGDHNVEFLCNRLAFYTSEVKPTFPMSFATILDSKGVVSKVNLVQSAPRKLIKWSSNLTTNAKGSTIGAVFSTNLAPSQWGSSFVYSATALLSSYSMFTGVEFKLQESGSMVGLACEEDVHVRFRLTNDTCYYAIVRDDKGEPFIKERGSNMTRPAQVSKATWSADFGRDTWAVRLSQHNYVEFLRNGRVFYLSAGEFAPPMKILVMLTVGSASDMSWV